MRFSKLSRNMHVRDLVIQLFVEWMGLLNNSIAKVCNLFITFFFTMGYLFIRLVSSWNVEISISPVWWYQFVQMGRMGIRYGSSSFFNVMLNVNSLWWINRTTSFAHSSQTNWQPVHASEHYCQKYLFQILVNGKGYKECYRKLFVLLFCKWCWALTTSSR